MANLIIVAMNMKRMNEAQIVGSYQMATTLKAAKHWRTVVMMNMVKKIAL